MTATLTSERPGAAVPHPGRARRARVARLERPLLFAGLAREPRLQAVVADGPTRPVDGAEVNDPGAYARRTIAFLDHALDPKETP